MQKLCVFVIAYVVLSALSMHAAQAKNVVVGVNVVGVDQLSEQQQDALIEQLARNGVKTIRMGLVNQKYARFIARASERGINTVAIVYPTQGSSGAHMRPADPSLGLPWRVEALSDADPEGFRKWFMPQLATLEAVGVRLAAFELGNEINTPNYNGDFPAQATGRILGLSDLNNSNDPEAQAIAAGYRAYLKVMAALKDLRDRSQLNRTTPIVSAGLADWGLPRPKPGSKLDEVSIPDTIEFLRQNGMDKLVDAYGVHVYPNDDPHTPLSARVSVLDQDIFAACRQGAKPCWLTEWGFTNNDKSCQLSDATRVHLIQTMRDAFEPFVEQGRLAAVINYSWIGLPGTESGFAIFRCGTLTDAGKLALSPM